MKNPRRRDGRTEKSLRSNGRLLLGRVLGAESLEQRQLLAGDVVTSPHHNSWHALDVNNDLRVTPTDALVVLNDLNRSGVRELNGESPSPSKFIDVNGDGRVSALDALQVINFLINQDSGGGEPLPAGEPLGDIAPVTESSTSSNSAKYDTLAEIPAGIVPTTRPIVAAATHAVLATWSVSGEQNDSSTDTETAEGSLTDTLELLFNA